MEIQTRFAGVFRLTRQGAPLKDPDAIAEALAKQPVPQGTIHFSEPASQSFFIVTPPDEDEFNRLIDNLGTAPDRHQAFKDLYQAIIDKSENFEV